MAKMNGMNANYREVAGYLKGFGRDKVFAREVLEVMVADGKTRTFNSVNATLAAMAGKGYVAKEKGVYKDKLLTHYTLTELGLSELEKPEEKTEDKAEA